MNRSAPRERNISIRSIIISMVAVTLVITALLLTATFNADTGYARLKAIQADYVQWEHDANNLQLGSDYLTEQVRCFVVTGKRQYLDNYFEEANVTRRRDKAVESVHSVLGDTPAYEALVAAMGESVALMDREYYAMRLTAAAYEYDLSDFPEEIRNVGLSDQDMALSPEEQDRQARAMVFDDFYHEKKEAITRNIQDCLTAMDEALDARQKDTEAAMRRLLIQQRVMIVISIVTTIAALLLFHLLVVKPLLRAVGFIHSDQILPAEGSEEFQFLARAYNTVHESNREQKEELAYEATHDKLTEVYNRNGYDYIQHNVDWSTSALVLFDLDYFKQVNDTYGHSMGDRVLARTAAAIQSAFRAQDYVCRIGGDEFAVIMVHVTTDSAELIREKVRRINEELMVPQDDMPGIHLSCGAAYGANIPEFDRLFREADAALYRIKNTGGCGCEVCGSEQNDAKQE